MLRIPCCATDKKRTASCEAVSFAGHRKKGEPEKVGAVGSRLSNGHREFSRSQNG